MNRHGKVARGGNVGIESWYAAKWCVQILVVAHNSCFALEPGVTDQILPDRIGGPDGEEVTLSRQNVVQRLQYWRALTRERGGRVVLQVNGHAMPRSIERGGRRGSQSRVAQAHVRLHPQLLYTLIK